MGDVVLRVEGQRYSGWLSVEVSRNLESLAGEFTVGVVMESTAQLPAIVRGQEVLVEIEGQRAISGWVRKTTSKITGEELSMTVTGRDYTADLVDCSAVFKAGSWANQNLEQIARDLLSLFHIEVVWQVADAKAAEPFPRFKLDHSETVFEALSRGAKQRGIILTSDPLGRVVFTEPGLAGTAEPLMLGDNLLECEYVDDDSDRFSVYQVLGDSAGGSELGESMLLEQVTSVTGTFVDDAVPRWRPKQIWAGTSTKTAAAQSQAQTERARALSQGQRVTAQVRGWQQRDGALWPLNAITAVTAPILGLQARELLIVDIRFALDDDGGELATLTLAPKEGYDLPREVIPSEQAQAWQGIGITQEQFDREIPSHLKRLS
ncbi:phage late control protein GPD [compost metagenome]